MTMIIKRDYYLQQLIAGDFVANMADRSLLDKDLIS